MYVRNATYEEFRLECEELRQMHYLEVVAHRGAQYSLDHDFYEALEENLRIVIAYDNEETPIGYSLTVVSNGVHDDTRAEAVSDMFFMHPDHRRSLSGYKLLKVAEADLKAFAPGALWRIAVPIDERTGQRRGLEKLDFKATERVYEKVLGG